MAAAKRKAVASERPAKKIKFDENGKARSVPNTPDKTAIAKKKSKPADEPQRKPPKSTLLLDEDRSFPRGGASVLTPLEQRQIRAEADRDVLFEEQGKSKVVREEYGEDEDAAKTRSTKTANKNKKKGKQSREHAGKADGEEVKIHGLGYKNLTTGSLVLGQVTNITSKDVALALPNNLTGFIPITAVSDSINTKIQSLLTDDGENEKENDADESDDDDDVDLKKLFRPGQYLRAYVTATASESSAGGLAKTKRHIELSVNPRQANTGLEADSLSANYLVQAAIKSVEDHGVVVDLGLEDESVRGFISKKELGQQWNIEHLQHGQVLLCCVTGSASDGKVVKLCPDPLRVGDLSKRVLKEATTIDPFIPGTPVEVLVTAISAGGLTGKIMGSIDATTDVMHSGAGLNREAFDKIKVGQKVLGRIIYTLPGSEDKKVGFSLLDHIRKFEEQPKSGKKKAKQLRPSELVETAKVTQVLPGIGLFLDVGISGQPGFAHISKLADERVDALFEETGPFALNSTHRARVLGYNPIDGVYNLSLQKSVLDRKFLKLEDVQVGSLVDGKVEKLILGAKGITGILVTLDEGITGLVPEMHMSDVKLQHPEKRFRENFPVKARVLSVDVEKRQMRLTLKKALLNSDSAVWKDYSDISVGAESAGTVIKVQSNGAVLQFYSNVRAWLPVSEMSEAYIVDATQHFRLGQTVMVHAKQVNPIESEMVVSCRDSVTFSEEQSAAWAEIKPGQIVVAKINEISSDNASMEVEGSLIKGLVKTTHFTDGNEEKSKKLMQKLRVGQKLSEVLVLSKNENQHILALTLKPSLLNAAKSNELITRIEDAKVGAQAAGFVRNITPDGIFVEFAASLVAYLPKTQIAKEILALPAFGYRKDMSISARILHVDANQKRLALTMRDVPTESMAEKKTTTAADVALVNPVDGVSSSLGDLALGKQTQARITSVKDTQINVQLADNIQGRVDVSEAFNSWDDIKDRKRPLAKFKPKQVIDVKILGVHDARNHRFLPISHRQSKIPVFELTAKLSTNLAAESDHLTLAKLDVGSEWVAFVNNVAEGCLWANITPNVRGRIDFMDLTDDTAALQNISKHFPIGSALRVKVKGRNTENNRLDLVSTSASSHAPQSLTDVSVGSILPGKVVRVTERSVLVALSDSVNGVIGMTDMSDDYSEAITTKFNKNDVIRVCVIDVDVPNKRLFLSTRPSRILSSSLPVADPQITAINQIKTLDVVRGFVKLVRSNGLIVSLGPRVEAFVRISDLSDSYIKDWQSEFSVDQLVRGKVLAVDSSLNHVQLSLKASHVDKDYVPPRKLEDLEEGETVTGKVRKVEEFGVFIDVDDTLPRVSGLCHRSQIADSKVGDVKKLYDEGDAVKAKVLKIDLEKRRISFGLKASYFADDSDVSNEEMEDSDDEQHDGVPLGADSDDEMDVNGGVDLTEVLDIASEEESEIDDMDVDDPIAKVGTTGLKTSGFDWTGAAPEFKKQAAGEDSDSDAAPVVKSSRKKSSQPTFTDRTGDLDIDGPQSAADYERHLLSSPHDSQLWVAYMAFHLRLSEVQAARDIGRRALSTIPLREIDEKMNVWIALLNLEVSYSSSNTGEYGQAAVVDTDDALERVFREVCAVQDPYAMHLHLASIFNASAKQDKADLLYQSMLSSNPSLGPSPFRAPVATAKMTKSFRALPDLWLNYASFLMEHMHDAGRARALLPRALQSVPERAKRDLTVDFAKLEFRYVPPGDPERGRTLLEGVVGEWPRLATAWDAWLDAEIGLLSKTQEKDADQVERTRKLFERMVGGKMKARRAKYVFKRWREFEEKYGDKRGAERVVGLAKEWVEKAKGGEEEE
ncbi:nucleic acid-binding protein [Myriangium duriaei CBS 260.36]|uniref:rRNA biogenesis protein RRP5 n=1 Tax=Myriangium duriaei CBS 260.36 TaxID=1168546 RepID=A0A9P4JDN7_9PEZI|nr:nucleic acid-binding protein [Myriangium duriaei CBS 260.36]